MRHWNSLPPETGRIWWESGTISSRVSCNKSANSSEITVWDGGLNIWETKRETTEYFKQDFKTICSWKPDVISETYGQITAMFVATNPNIF